ncbi:HD domain-containing protein [Anaeromassilibacillus senegalensis]|uniref:HD domain-containing protein n=1 Tax=Anaeromassilibacillus senegalensis TaxID=1673717 RepID=UPI000680C8B6|nr:HD domain-containing protein [Anaeromassilibacillus senegalensis]
MGYKEEFEEIFRSKITRDGSEALFEWLSRTDFFTAPASTKFHCACLGGLVQHSVNVYRTMMEKQFDPETDNEESFAICGLLHDVCKAQFYKEGTRNVKNEQTGAWEKKAYYMVEDSFPYGHGEKSVFLIERFLRLKTSEAVAIRWHMGGFDDAVRGGSFALSQAYEKYPLAVKLHLADLESTYLREKGTSAVRARK